MIAMETKAISQSSSKCSLQRMIPDCVAMISRKLFEGESSAEGRHKKEARTKERFHTLGPPPDEINYSLLRESYVDIVR
jgi:hypothetical protein